MNCIICCEEESKPVKLNNCDCSICPLCLIMYIKFNQKTSNENINLTSHISCPGECSSSYSISELITDTDLQRDLNIVLLLKYLQTESDIRACPRNNCGNFGVLPSTCNAQLVCQACDYRWDAPELYTPTKRIMTSMKNYHQSTDFLLNHLSQWGLTKDCPRCQIPIQKDGGCDHMTCRQCGYEFCWLCKQEYYEHKRTVCLTHRVIKYAMMIQLMVYFVFLMDLDDMILQHVGSVFGFILRYNQAYNNKSFILSNAILIYLITLFIYTYRRQKLQNELDIYYPHRNVKLLNSKLQDSSIGLFFIIVLYSLYLNNSIIEWSLFMINELVIGSSIFVCYQITKMGAVVLFREWFKYVR